MKAINECSTVQLIRSATIKVSLGGTTFLIDPMLAEKGAFSGFPESMNSPSGTRWWSCPSRLRKC